MEDGREKETQPLSLRLIVLYSDAETMVSDYLPLLQVIRDVLTRMVADGTDYPLEKILRVFSAQQLTEFSACCCDLLCLANAYADESSVLSLIGTMLWHSGMQTTYNKPKLF